MMANAQHTPGPFDWLAISANASGGHHLYIIDSNNRKIAALWGRAEEKTANACLFAASPDLLAAARAAVAWFDEMRPVTGPGTLPMQRAALKLRMAKP